MQVFSCESCEFFFFNRTFPVAASDKFLHFQEKEKRIFIFKILQIQKKHNISMTRQ